MNCLSSVDRRKYRPNDPLSSDVIADHGPASAYGLAFTTDPQRLIRLGSAWKPTQSEVDDTNIDVEDAPPRSDDTETASSTRQFPCACVRILRTNCSRRRRGRGRCRETSVPAGTPWRYVVAEQAGLIAEAQDSIPPYIRGSTRCPARLGTTTTTTIIIITIMIIMTAVPVAS